MIEVGIIDPSVARADLGSVVIFYVEQISVVNIFLNFSIFQFHLVDVLSNLMGSSSQPFVHLFVSMVGSDVDSYLFIRRAFSLEVGNIRLNLLSLVSENVQLTIQGISDVEEVL